MGDFAIISEEAIAKGIRRIVAITGLMAAKAVNKAQYFNKEILKIEKMILADERREKTKEILDAIIRLSDNILESTISAWEKVIIFNRTN
jgi:alanyl-tRNA synthetase